MASPQPKLKGSINPFLSKQEIRVLNLIWEGYGTKEIASKLGIVPKTVMTHRATLHNKMSVNNVIKLVRKGLDLGYLDYQLPINPS